MKARLTERLKTMEAQIGELVMENRTLSMSEEGAQQYALATKDHCKMLDNQIRGLNRRLGE